MAPDLWALRTHRLGLMAAKRLGARGQPLPQWLVLEQRACTLTALVTPIVLNHIRQACMARPRRERASRGGAISQRARSYNDLDILVPDAQWFTAPCSEQDSLRSMILTSTSSTFAITFSHSRGEVPGPG